MHEVPSRKFGRVRIFIDNAINALFNDDPNLHNEYDVHTYEALENALTFQTAKDVSGNDVKTK